MQTTLLYIELYAFIAWDFCIYKLIGEVIQTIDFREMNNKINIEVLKCYFKNQKDIFVCGFHIRNRRASVLILETSINYKLFAATQTSSQLQKKKNLVLLILKK